MEEEDTPQSLIARISGSNRPEDWARLYGLFYPLLMRWVHPMVPQASDAEDVVQEVLTIVLKKVPDFRHSGTRGVFRSWLRAILVIKVREFWRRQNHVPKASDASGQFLLSLESDGTEISRQWDAEHDKHVLEQLMRVIQSEFEEATWSAFVKTELGGLTVQQVADELGVSTNAVYVSRSRVWKRLQTEATGLADLLAGSRVDAV